MNTNKKQRIERNDSDKNTETEDKNFLQSIISKANILSTSSNNSEQFTENLEDLKIQAMEKAASTLSKSLDNSTSNSPLSWLMQQISTVIALEEVPPKSHHFKFENNKYNG